MEKGKRKGFAALSEEEHLHISRRGGQAAAESGNAHQFTSEEARAAGKKSARAKRRKHKDEEQRG